MNGIRTALVATVVLLLLFLVSGSGAREVTDTARPRNFIFFGTDRQRISETGFLENEHIAGAQLKYTWRELEPERDRYELQPLLDDLAFLERHGKRLFVQLQDVSFSEDILVPEGTENVKVNSPIAKLSGEGEGAASSPSPLAGEGGPAEQGRMRGLSEPSGKAAAASAEAGASGAGWRCRWGCGWMATTGCRWAGCR